MSITEKQTRTFVSNELSFRWENIKPYFEDLSSRKIGSKSDLLQWLKDRSEVNAVLEEEFAWRYIRINIDTTNA